MAKVDQYIKRLLAFILCSLLYFFSLPYFPFFVSIPVLSLTFSLLHFRITEERPPHLFAFYRTEEYFKKGGIRDLLRILVTILGFLFDVVVWAIWGIYLVYVLVIDLLDLLKTIFFWIIHGILWIFRQYVPFVVFLFKIAIHYLIKWPWWLYRIAYRNLRFAFNKNFYRVALPGTLLAGFIIFLFYFIEIMLEGDEKVLNIIKYIGIILSLLPLTWSFGEIASIRAQKTHKENYQAVKAKFQNGIEAVRSVLFYIMLFVVLILAQLGLNLLGWIPDSGVPIGSFIFNINTLISILLLFICILIVFGVIIIPSYRIYNPFSELRFSHSATLLGTIARKFLQYITIALPSAFFSAIAMAIPALIMIVVAYFTMYLKDYMVEIRIENLRSNQITTQDPVLADSYQKQIDHLIDLQQFPVNITQEMKHRGNITSELLYSKEDIKTENEEYLQVEENYEKKISALQKEIELRLANNPADLTVDKLSSEKEQLQNQFDNFKRVKKVDIAKLNSHINYLTLKKKQIPLLYFFGGVWLVIFGGMVFAFAISYLGNVFYRIFVFRNDTKESYWLTTIAQIREKDNKQPLLGATLFIITAFLVYFMLSRISLLSKILTFFTDLVSY
ncbi:MAG: hypothetical protein JXB24_07630 [Bacteroidales bacterium]|nr:hypothetical protein [Bacteroidales bacterium]